MVGGLDIPTATNNSNVSTVFATLKPWDERKAKNVQFKASSAPCSRGITESKDGFIFAFGLPPILGLGTSGGFRIHAGGSLGGDIEALAQATDQLVAAARARPELQNVISTFRNTVPQYKVNLDRDKVQTLGVPVTDVYNALQTFLGGLYVNDFNRFGRTWRVYLQAEPDFRRQPSDINRFYVRTERGDMVPLSTLVTYRARRRPGSDLSL